MGSKGIIGSIPHKGMEVGKKSSHEDTKTKGKKWKITCTMIQRGKESKRNPLK